MLASPRVADIFLFSMVAFILRQVVVGSLLFSNEFATDSVEELLNAHSNYRMVTIAISLLARQLLVEIIQSKILLAWCSC